MKSVLRSSRCCLNAFGVILLICRVAPALPQTPNKDQGRAPSSKFRVVRSMCGAKGTSHGADFEMQDPRCSFHVPEDHQVIVFFEWDGPPGSHHAVGTWRRPDGKVVLTSDFDLTSSGTIYRGTWTLAIPESIAPGLWALEAQIDGQPAGTQTFEITPSHPEPTAPPIPSAAEVYKHAAPAAAFVTSLDQDGEPITHGLGFFVDKGTLLTAFQVIDGASTVRIDFADGTSQSVGKVVAWSRKQDWAILRLESAAVPPLEKAAPNSWKIGDLCYVVMSRGQGSRTIQTVNITGLQGNPPSEQRLTISGFGPGASLGAPLLDAYGRVIGIIGGGLPGLASRRMGSWVTYVDPGEMAATMAEVTVLPVTEIPEAAASQQPVTFADLASRGVFLMPLARNSQAAAATLCDDYQNFQRQAILPLRPRSEFARKQGMLAFVVTWGPNEKIKTTEQLRIYDADNRLVAQTAPSKIELQIHVTGYSAWRVPLASLQPGIYRIDLVLGDQPQWRQFFLLRD